MVISPLSKSFPMNNNTVGRSSLLSPLERVAKCEKESMKARELV